MPLLLRLAMWVLSLVALALGVDLLRRPRSEREPRLHRAAVLTVIVSGTAAVFLLFITYDEYSSKPLGLRAPSVKLRLLLLDLVFVVAMTANMTQSAHNFWARAYVAAAKPLRERRQQVALITILAVTLAVWLVTFVITAFRLVARVAREADL